MMAARDAEFEVVELLLNAGANNNAAGDMFGRTALDLVLMAVKTIQEWKGADGEMLNSALSCRSTESIKECKERYYKTYQVFVKHGLAAPL